MTLPTVGLPPILSFDAATFMEQGSMMSREHLLLRLRRNHLVIHSTPPTGRHVAAPPGGVQSLMDGLYHYTNPWFLPDIYRFNFLNRVSVRLRTAHRKNILRKIGNSERPILYMWHPCFEKEIGCYDENLLVYHIYDDYAALPGSRPELAESEISILERADLVFVANESLLKKRKSVVDRDYIHMPQGVDFSSFEIARNLGESIPEDLGSIPGPRIGYIGRLNNKVDIGLVADIAQSRPDWSFVFIGPVDRVPETQVELQRIDALPNVYFLGRKPFGEISRYWLHLDVAIIPYRHASGQWAHFGSPLKLREAFAAGKPVVASPLEDIESFNGLAAIALTLDQWLHEIEKALDSSADANLRDARLSYARENSWDARAMMIEGLMANKIKQKSEG